MSREFSRCTCCGEVNGQEVHYCRQCGHEAHVALLECQCQRCMDRDGTLLLTSSLGERNLVVLDRKRWRNKRQHRPAFPKWASRSARRFA